MPDKRVALVTGATGLLGRQVVRAFEQAGWKAVGTGLTRANPPSILKVDLGDDVAVGKVLDETLPHVVIHCAANRFPDQCDANPSAARDLNITATERLAKLTFARSILLVYISTDYVFPGPPGEAPYEATSAPKPPNLYGQTKLDGEKVVLEVAGERGLGVVLRVPVLYGAVEDSFGNKESAINVLMDAVWKAQDKEAKVVMDDWAQRYPTNTEDVARVLVDLAAKYLDNGEGRGGLPKILQFSSEDRMTKYQICQSLADIMGLPLDGMVANKDGGGGGVQRPYDTHLSSQSLKDLGISTRTMDFTAWWRWQAQAYRK